MKEEVVIQSSYKTTAAKNENNDGILNPYEFSDRDMEIVLERTIKNIPDFHTQSKPVRLSGGLLNYVWRIQGESNSLFPSLIAKCTPPFIASNP